MSVNLFSLETLTGLIIGLLLGFFIKNVFKKKEDSGDYASNLRTLTDKLEEFQDENAEDRGILKAKIDDVKAGETEVVKAADRITNTLVSGGGQQQGDWGELVLKNILTKHLQFREGEEFDIRKSFSTEDGNKIPDVIVHYPDGRDILVDSKVSLTAWDEYVNATDDLTKKDALKRHKKSIKDHIDELAEKNYQDIKEINTLDTVIMFCANEDAFFKLPDKSSSKVIGYALSKKITLSSSSTIHAVLKSVEKSWKVERQSKNIKDIIDIANKVCSQAVDIYKAAEGAKKHIKTTSDEIEKVTNQINRGEKSFVGRIMEMIKLGGLFPKKQLHSDIIEDENPDDDHPAEGASGKISISNEEKKPADLIADKKK